MITQERATAIAVEHLAGHSGEITDYPISDYPSDVSVPAPAWWVIVHPAEVYIGCTTFVAVAQADGRVLRVIRHGE